MDKWRTPEAADYRKLYHTKQWRTLREQVLLRDLFTCQHKGCKAMLKRGRAHKRSAVVHHLNPHKGDHDLFFDVDNLQSVCWSCHSGDIQSIESRGFDVTIGEDGWPIDPNHTGNA
jgi:5-methylcytosine-specific restriction endonuclease McrA